MKTFILIIFACFMISCNENGPVNNGSDKTAIDKSITPSSSEQILESTDGIRVIIPGGALNTDLGIKLVKLANPPQLSDTKIMLGTNIFQLSLNGDLNFNSTIQFRVKYDKSKIQSVFTPQTGVKGMMFTNNVWSVSEFEIDVTNEEIVFFVEPTVGKSFKDKEILLDNSEVTFGDGYTINDSGQEDSKLLGFLKTCKYVFADADALVKWSDGETSNVFDGDGSGVEFQPYYTELESNPPKFVWTGDHIDVSYPGYNVYYHIYGDFNKDGSIKEMTFEFDDKYGWTAKLILKDVALLYTGGDPMSYAFYVIPVNGNDLDRKRFIIDFRITEMGPNGSRTSSTIDWTTFSSQIFFKLMP